MEFLPPIKLSEAACLIIVSALWGFTNLLLKNNSKGIEKVERQGKVSQIVAEFIFLVTNWKYALSFLANQSGSVLYYITLSGADLTLAVPVTNSMTFIFTALSSHLLGEKNISFRASLGMVMVAAGVLLCVLSKADNSTS